MCNVVLLFEVLLIEFGVFIELFVVVVYVVWCLLEESFGCVLVIGGGLIG